MKNIECCNQNCRQGRDCPLRKPRAFTIPGESIMRRARQAKVTSDTTPSNSGIVLGDHRTQVERKAVGAIYESRIDVVAKWMRRAGRK